MEITRKQNRPAEEQIAKELRKMRVGNCGEKFGCLVWRIADDLFAVGRDSVHREETRNLDDAASLIRVYN